MKKAYKDFAPLIWIFIIFFGATSLALLDDNMHHHSATYAAAKSMKIVNFSYTPHKEKND